jgi:AraC-like DNA-binding protein
LTLLLDFRTGIDKNVNKPLLAAAILAREALAILRCHRTGMTSNLPLIRLSAANPFLLELRRRKARFAELLREMDLPETVPASSELFVSSHVMYRIVERSSEIADDPYFGFTVGQKIDLHDWAPIAKASETANTVGDLLNHFIVNAIDHSSSTRFFVRTEGNRTTFGFRRLTSPPLLPAQNDAFYLGLLVKVLEKATRDQWDPAEALFRVADPDAVPPLPQSFRITKGDELGMHISFPSTWLFERIKKASFAGGLSKSLDTGPPKSLIESLHLALLPHMHESDLNIGRAAKICGFDSRRLSAELRSRGTTLGKEIAALRARHAQKGLVNSNKRIFDIAQSVGFKDPTVFSRAFKNWTGQSPQEYRRTHR